MHTHASSTPTLTSCISDMLEPPQGDGGISEAALAPVVMGIVPTAVWSEGSERQGDKKHREVEEAVSQGGG